jgi:fluoroquinolone transport system ATP-binding protein
MFQVNNLTFRYPKNKENTINGINFALEEGEIFGLLGPSGVGKSTTQKILIKLLEGYGGEVLFKGNNLKSYGKEFYQEIGVGFEMPVHFSKLTANENLNFFKQLYKSNGDTDELLKRVGLYEDREKQVGEYSKGMKVRLNFVRALLNNPTILFLDEPTNGLDPQNARIIKDMIKEFKQQGGTVLLTTHLMNDVDELCDRVAFMARGKIVEIETPKSLKLKHGDRKVELEYSEGDLVESDIHGNGAVRKETFDLDSLRTNEAFMNIVKTKEIITMHSKETTLDDIFIKVTGVEKDE